MAKAEHILDGLAWAGLKESARVARLAAQIIRNNVTGYRGDRTQSIVKEEIRKTAPPYGRSKHIFKALWGTDDNGEIARQEEIHNRRQTAQREWEQYQKRQSQLDTRLNNAYAAAFDRPSYCPRRSYQGGWMDYDARREFDEKERARDKGDECIGITHQGEHVVALVISENEDARPHIAVRRKRGGITRTYIRCVRYEQPRNLAEAALMLGGNKAKAALAKGKRVETDWVGRRTLIHHDGSDHEEPKIEEVPWEVRICEEVQAKHTYTGEMTTKHVWVDALVKGREVIRQ